LDRTRGDRLLPPPRRAGEGLGDRAPRLGDLDVRLGDRDPLLGAGDLDLALSRSRFSPAGSTAFGDLY